MPLDRRTLSEALRILIGFVGIVAFVALVIWGLMRAQIWAENERDAAPWSCSMTLTFTVPHNPFAISAAAGAPKSATAEIAQELRDLAALVEKEELVYLDAEALAEYHRKTGDTCVFTDTP